MPERRSLELAADLPAKGRPPSRALVVASAIAPLVLLAALVAWFVNGGSRLIERPVPPIEEVSIRRAELVPGEIRLSLRNTGPLPVDLTVVTVDEAIWKAAFSPGRHLERMQTATVRIPYDWVEGDPYKVEVFTTNGFSFSKEIAVATASPRASWRMFGVFAAMGLYIGILPVAFGILWLPLLRRLSPSWTQFMLSLTLGLLVFLGVDALHEGMEAADALPGVFAGMGLLAIGFLLAFLGVTAISRPARAVPGRDGAMALAVAIAFGIGVHNLGEGLAVGAAYALGEVALGAMLLVGFAIHNTTEGLAIVAPLTRSRPRLLDLVGLGVLGGAPAILGCWLGGFGVSDLWAVFFLAIGAGAIFQVVWTIGKSMAEAPGGNLFAPRNAWGFLVGMGVMYGTALLVSA